MPLLLLFCLKFQNHCKSEIKPKNIFETSVLPDLKHSENTHKMRKQLKHNWGGPKQPGRLSKIFDNEKQPLQFCHTLSAYKNLARRKVT